MMTVELSACTDRGCVRTKNEDSWDIISAEINSKSKTMQMDAKGVLLAVADGMGGTNAGEIASHIAIDTIRQEFLRMPKLMDSKARLNWLSYIIEVAHSNIIKYSLRNPQSKGMGTTVVLAWLLEDSAHIAWVGDSRCYLHREGRKFEPFTDDHSLVWEQVKKGTMNAEQARFSEQSNVILESLGDAKKPPKVDCRLLPLQQGDRLLLCSDGLNSMLSDREIEKIFTNTKSDPNVLSDQLVWAATAAGGLDNVTVLTAHVAKGRAVAVSERDARNKVRSRALTFALSVLLVLLATAFVFTKSTDEGNKNARQIAENLPAAVPVAQVDNNNQRVAEEIAPPAVTTAAALPIDTIVQTALAPTEEVVKEEKLGYIKTKKMIQRMYFLQYEKFEVYVNRSAKLLPDKCPNLTQAEIDSLIAQSNKSMQYLDLKLAQIPGVVWDTNARRTITGYTPEFAGTLPSFFEQIVTQLNERAEKTLEITAKINQCQSLNK